MRIQSLAAVAAMAAVVATAPASALLGALTPHACAPAPECGRGTALFGVWTSATHGVLGLKDGYGDHAPLDYQYWHHADGTRHYRFDSAGSKFRVLCETEYFGAWVDDFAGWPLLRPLIESVAPGTTAVAIIDNALVLIGTCGLREGEYPTYGTDRGYVHAWVDLQTFGRIDETTLSLVDRVEYVSLDGHFFPAQNEHAPPRASPFASKARVQGPAVWVPEDSPVRPENDVPGSGTTTIWVEGNQPFQSNAVTAFRYVMVGDLTLAGAGVGTTNPPQTVPIGIVACWGQKGGVAPRSVGYVSVGTEALALRSCTIPGEAWLGGQWSLRAAVGAAAEVTSSPLGPLAPASHADLVAHTNALHVTPGA